MIVVSINFVHEFRPRERDHTMEKKKIVCWQLPYKTASWDIVCRQRNDNGRLDDEIWKASDSKAQFIRKFINLFKNRSRDGG